MTHLLKELQRILVFPVIIKGEKEQTVFAVFFCMIKCTFRILVKRFPIAGGLCGIKERNRQKLCKRRLPDGAVRKFYWLWPDPVRRD